MFLKMCGRKDPFSKSIYRNKVLQYIHSIYYTDGMDTYLNNSKIVILQRSLSLLYHVPHCFIT